MRQIVIIFLAISFKESFRCLKEPSEWNGSFEYPQRMAVPTIPNFSGQGNQNNLPLDSH